MFLQSNLKKNELLSPIKTISRICFYVSLIDKTTGLMKNQKKTGISNLIQENTKVFVQDQVHNLTLNNKL